MTRTTNKSPLLTIKWGKRKNQQLSFYTAKAYEAFINFWVAIEKDQEYPEPFITWEAKPGIGKALIPEIIKKAIKKPIIL